MSRWMDWGVGKGEPQPGQESKRERERVNDKEAKKIYRSRTERRGDSGADNVRKTETKSEREGKKDSDGDLARQKTRKS